jgi:hypothetical protein
VFWSIQSNKAHHLAPARRRRDDGTLSLLNSLCSSLSSLYHKAIDVAQDELIPSFFRPCLRVKEESRDRSTSFCHRDTTRTSIGSSVLINRQWRTHNAVVVQHSPKQAEVNSLGPLGQPCHWRVSSTQHCRQRPIRTSSMEDVASPLVAVTECLHELRDATRRPLYHELVGGDTATTQSRRRTWVQVGVSSSFV